VLGQRVCLGAVKVRFVHSLSLLLLRRKCYKMCICFAAGEKKWTRKAPFPKSSFGVEAASLRTGSAAPKGRGRELSKQDITHSAGMESIEKGQKMVEQATTFASNAAGGWQAVKLFRAPSFQLLKWLKVGKLESWKVGKLQLLATGKWSQSGKRELKLKLVRHRQFDLKRHGKG